MRLNRCGWGASRPLGRLALITAVVMATAGTLTLAYGHRSVSRVALNRPAAIPSSPQKIVNLPRVRADYAALPMTFEANEGQTDPQVRYLARGSGYGLFLTQREAVLALQSGTHKKAALRMKLAGGNTRPQVTGEDQFAGKSNYLIGSDSSKWHRNVPQFARVRYQDVYPGVDLVYYGKQGKLEYDFQVAPGASPKQIALQLEGGQSLKLTRGGDVVVATEAGNVRLHAPRIYQKNGNEKQEVSGRFVARGANEIGFAVGSYDHKRALVIDPVLSYSTYLGGSGNEACSAISGSGTPVSGCPAIAVDSAANIYIAGSTTSADFPVSSGAAQATLTGAANVFVTKLTPGGSGSGQLVFSTYLGGSGMDMPAGVAVGPGGNVVVAGTTSSSDFPAQNGYQTAPKAAGTHAFVTELDSAGGSILYSTYLSGSATDTAKGLALDIDGNAYIIGTTSSSDFPTSTGALQPTSLATNQFFVSKVKLNPITVGPAGLAYSTYFGGGYPANGVVMGGGIAVDSSGNVYITGGTNFQNTQAAPQNGGGNDFPILNASQPCLGHPENPTSCPSDVTTMDAFAAKINPTAVTTAQLLYSTYLGGSGDEVGYGIVVDSGGAAYITGSTSSLSSVSTSVTAGNIIIPTGAVPLQSCLDAPSNPSPCPTGVTAPDAFVAKFTNPGSTQTPTTLAYFSYLGGSGNDTGTSVAVDSQGGSYITGWTQSTDFPVQNAITGSSPGGSSDAFVARLDTTATSDTVGAVDSSSYLGGSAADAGTSIFLDPFANLYVAGETTSGNFPTANPFQATLSGPSDAFITELGPTVNLGVVETASPSPVGVGNEVTFTYTITNNSNDLTSGITFTDAFSTGNATFVTAAAPGGCGSVSSAGTISCMVGSLVPSGTATVSVTLTPNSGGTLSDNGRFSIVGRTQTFAPSAPAAASVNDFTITAAPTSVTEPAGVPATYTINVNPTPGTSFPESISLSCTSGLPTPGSCSFTNNPIPSLVGSVSRSLVINTTARTTTTSQLLRKGKLFYAGWLPIFGFTLAGAGLGSLTRKRRIALGIFLGMLVTLVLFQAGCGHSGSTTTTSGTPAGTYSVTVTGTSGGATRTTVIQLTVQ